MTTYSTVGSPWHAAAAPGTSVAVAVSPSAVGDVLVLFVSTNYQASTQPQRAVSGVSGGGVTTWNKLVAELDPTASSGHSSSEIWWGVITATGAATVTVTFAGSVYVGAQVAQFNSSSGGTWTADTNVGAGLSGAVASASIPSITAAASGELYLCNAGTFHYGFSETLSWSGATGLAQYPAPGTVYPAGAAYNLSPGTTAQAPTWTYTRNSYYIAEVAGFLYTTVPGYTVTFDANGGSGTMANEGPYSTPTALTLNSFTRTGFTFSHWNTAADNSGTSYADGASYPFAASATLYAIWAATAGGALTATFGGASSGVVTKIPTTAAVAAAFTGAAAVALRLPSANVQATYSGAFASPEIRFSASGNVTANFAGAFASPSVTAFANAAVTATFSATFSPEGLGTSSAVTAAYVGASSGVSITFATAAGVLATFTGASASGTPVVHLYSTQAGNQYVTDITSYGLHANVRVYVTVGVPTANLGNDGDYAMRRDTTNGSGVQMYHRSGGAWTAIA